MRDRLLAVEAYRKCASKSYSILGWVDGPAAEAADLRGVGADILDIDHMVDMREARHVLGPGVVLTGNIDLVNGVLLGSPESIRAAMRQIYSQVGSPCLVNAGCETPSGMPVENLRALCEPIAVS